MNRRGPHRTYREILLPKRRNLREGRFSHEPKSSSHRTITREGRQLQSSDSQERVRSTNLQFPDVPHCISFERSKTCADLNRKCPLYHNGVDCYQWYKSGACSTSHCHYKHRDLDRSVVDRLLRKPTEEKNSTIRLSHSTTNTNNHNNDNNNSEMNKKEYLRDGTKEQNTMKREDESMSKKTTITISQSNVNSSPHTNTNNNNKGNIDNDMKNELEMHRNQNDETEKQRESKENENSLELSKSKPNETKFEETQTDNNQQEKDEQSQKSSQSSLEQHTNNNKNNDHYLSSNNSTFDSESKQTPNESFKSTESIQREDSKAADSQNESSSLSKSSSKLQTDSKVNFESSYQTIEKNVEDKSSSLPPPPWKRSLTSQGNSYFVNKETGEKTWSLSKTKQKQKEETKTTSSKSTLSLKIKSLEKTHSRKQSPEKSKSSSTTTHKEKKTELQQKSYRDLSSLRQRNSEQLNRTNSSHSRKQSPSTKSNSKSPTREEIKRSPSQNKHSNSGSSSSSTSRQLSKSKERTARSKEDNKSSRSSPHHSIHRHSEEFRERSEQNSNTLDSSTQKSSDSNKRKRSPTPVERSSKRYKSSDREREREQERELQQNRERNKTNDNEEWHRYYRSASEERHSQSPEYSHPISFSPQNSRHFGYPSTMMTYNERNKNNRDHSIHFYSDFSVPISNDPRRRLSSYSQPPFASFPPSSQFVSHIDSREQFNSSSTRGYHENSNFSFSNDSVPHYHRNHSPEYFSFNYPNNQSKFYSKLNNSQSVNQQPPKKQKEHLDIQNHKTQSEEGIQQNQIQTSSNRETNDLINFKEITNSNCFGQDKRNHFKENPPSDIIDLTFTSNQSTHFSIDKILSKIPISPTLAGCNLFEVIVNFRHQNFEDYFNVNRDKDVCQPLSSNWTVKNPNITSHSVVSTQESVIFESQHKGASKSFESSEDNATNDVSMEVNLYDDLGLNSTKETNLNEFTFEQGTQQYKNILIPEFTFEEKEYDSEMALFEINFMPDSDNHAFSSCVDVYRNYQKM